MKRLLLPLLTALALPTAVNANVDPQVNEMCMKATDYKGCVELNTKKSNLPKCNWIRKTNCIAEIKYDGGIYKGEISNNKPNGQGTFTHPKSEFTGQFKNGKFHGDGVFTTPDGTKLIGQFKDGAPHGQMHITVTYADGDKFTGQIKDRKKNGSGILIKTDGIKYEGQFKDDKYHGYGKWTSKSSGYKYVGQFKNGSMHGQGTITTSDGIKHVGQFKNGEAHGQGTVYYADGASWTGEFRNNERTKNGFYNRSPQEKANATKLRLKREEFAKEKELEFLRQLGNIYENKQNIYEDKQRIDLYIYD